MIKFRVPDNCVIIKKESKGVEYFMMNKKDVPDKNKSDEHENVFVERLNGTYERFNFELDSQFPNSSK